MTKFSPGPWRVCQIEGVTKYVATPSGYVVAAVGANGVYKYAIPANAALIAAAPELYEALRQIELVMHPDADQHSPVLRSDSKLVANTDAATVLCIVEYARAALAKVSP